ncbi:uncharacterized protein [Cardiocondyla obscurior]|uniref:uncharacterized protein n=1 Tax=Cardiocondyla obscurior TaxID=286306 RepID=UPI00396584E1
MDLHGFSDASQQAMAAVVYTRIIAENNSVTSQMICLKTKVALIKRLSIPRLKLTAVLILARLIKLIMKAFELQYKTLNCWSDSTVTIGWINSPPSKLKGEYVRNCVSLIYKTLPNCSWRFVSGKDNPADWATRGINADLLLQDSLWWHEPHWLVKAPEFWLRPKTHPVDEML